MNLLFFGRHVARNHNKMSFCSRRRLPFTFITSSVAGATCECLLARAEEAEMVIVEFYVKALHVCVMLNIFWFDCRFL